MDKSVTSGRWEIIGPDDGQQKAPPQKEKGYGPQLIEQAQQFVPENVQERVRYAAGPLARVIEYGLGGPGGLEELGTQALNYVAGTKPDKFSGPLDYFHYATGGGPLEKSGHILPTPSDIHEKITKRFFGESTEPKGPKEQIYQDVLTDIFQLTQGGMSGKWAAGLTGLGTLLKEGTKQMFGSETAGDVLKTGTYVLGGMVGTRAARKNAEKALYSRVEALASDEPLIDKSLESQLNHLNEQLKPHKFDGKDEVVKWIDHIKGTIKDLPATDSFKQQYVNEQLDKINNKFNKIFMTEGFSPLQLQAKTTALEDLGNKVNNLMSGKKGYSIKDLIVLDQDLNKQIYNPKTPTDQLPWLRKIKGTISDAIMGQSKNNPELVKTYMEAKKIHHALEKTSFVTDWMQDKLDINKLTNPLAKFILHGAASGGHVPSILAGVGVAQGMKGIMKAVDLAMNDPVARRMYLQGIRYGIQGNSSMMNKAFKKFDTRLNETMPENSNTQGSGRWEIIN